MSLLVYVLGLHFIADFVCQSPALANGKSRGLFWLTYHVLLYSAILSVGIQVWFYDDGVIAWRFWALTFITHWLTDFVTSRINRRMWDHVDDLRDEVELTRDRTRRALVQTRLGFAVHHFLVGIGADQYIHVLTLAATLAYLGLAPW